MEKQPVRLNPESRRKKLSAQAGFTLVEVLFSTAIIGLVVGGAIYALLMALQMSEDSRSRLLALNTARSTLETIKDTPVGSVTGIDASSYIPAELPGGAISITTNPTDASEEAIATVSVTVSWNGPKNMARTLTISTMRSSF